MEGKTREQGVGCQQGGKHGVRDEGEQGVDGWLEEWAEWGRGILVSFLAQHFPAHTTSKELNADPGGALSRAHIHVETFTHKPTLQHTLLKYC